MRSCFQPFLYCLLCCLALTISGVFPSFVCGQEDSIPERPPTAQLLPETTVAMIQIPNFRETYEKSMNSDGGQIFQDPEVMPLLEGLWEEAESAYENVKEDVGVELNDLASLPAGEVTVAVIAPRRKNPEFLVVLELNSEDETLDTLLDRGRQLVKEQPEVDLETATNDDGFEIESFNTNEGRSVHFFERDGLIVGSTSRDELDHFIDRWMGRPVEKTRPLTANRKFATIMNRCAGTTDLQPEFGFFVDPISLAKSYFRGNAGAQFGIAMLPLLGLDSLSAIGGTTFLDEKDYDVVAHIHVLLANPRTGIFSLLAFKPTDYQPDDFVPEEVTNLMMASIDARKAYAELTKIVDSFNDDGFFESLVQENINDELDIDLKKDLIDSMEGRISYIQWVEKPAMMQSVGSALAFKLNDVEKFQSFLDTLVEKTQELMEEQDTSEGPFQRTDYLGVTIYGESRSRVDQRNERIKQRRPGRGDDEDQASRVQMNIKLESPCLAIIGDSFVISINSYQLMQRMIETHRGEHPNLADNEDFAQLVDQSRVLLKNELPIGNFYSNPEGIIQWMGDLYQSENTQAVIGQASEANQYVAGVQRRMQENPLPEFDQLKKYFNKSGGFLTDDDTGLHLLQFSLRRDAGD